jgi:hypothetical protein
MTRRQQQRIAFWIAIALLVLIIGFILGVI